jgi:uncharacterized protein YecT (DUF1311 family)
MGRRNRLILLSFPLIFMACTAASAQAPASCKREGSTPRAYLDCLGNSQKDGEKQLERTMAGALAAIRGDEAISQVQRTRWVNLMEESQSRFVYWRNFECQSIAPYEGGAAKQMVGGRLGSGIGALEQRLVCLIERNQARIADISRRYPPPSGWTYTEPAPPEPAQAPEPPAPAGPVRIIEMPGQP